MITYPVSNLALYAGTLLALGTIIALWAVLGFTPGRCLRWLRQHWRLTTLYAAMTLVVGHLMFVAPDDPPNHPCVDFVELSTQLEYGVSCDSDQFIRVARNPGALAVEDSFRQGRPFQALVASLGAFVEDPHYPHHASASERDRLDMDDSPGCTGCLQSAVGGNPYGYENQPGWLPYVLLNFVQLLAAVLIFDRLLRRRGTGVSLPVALLAVLLLANVVSKNFFWSAHTQMWNVLLPVLSVAACAAVVREPDRDWRWMAAAGLLIGFGMLAYGSVSVIVPALIAAAAIGRRFRGGRLVTRDQLRPIGALIAGAVIPTLTWILLMAATAGSFHQSETEEHRQFIWIADSLGDGGLGRLLDEVGSVLSDFWTVLWPVMWPPLLLLAALLGIAPAAGISVREIAESRRDLLAAIAVTLLVCLPFFALLGAYRERLAFNLAVPVIIAAGAVALELTARARRPYMFLVNLALTCAAIGYLLAYTLKPAEYV